MRNDENTKQYRDGVVSIIIPIYNTQPYLSRCIESVMRQSYHNLQIILVDDGSTDSSADVCDQFARQDLRMLVIHKANGGVSSARNVGLINAVGEYISFIDSDDWVERDFIEKLVQNIESKKSDCSMCVMISEDERHEEYSEFIPYEKSELSGVEASERLCVTIGRSSRPPIFYVTNKLFRHHLWQGLCFDEGLYNGEDTWALFQVFQKIEKLSVIKNGLYHYRMDRVGSLTKHKDIDCDTEVAYRMYGEANRLYRNLNPYIENVVVHSLGKMRRSCLSKDINKYRLTCQAYKTFYPIAKHRIKESKMIYKLASTAVLFFPETVYKIVSIYSKIQGR